MKDFNLNLSINEVNLVLKALSQLPYHQVNDVISKIHAQAQDQLTKDVIDETKKTAKINP
jgi:hypothetical protein